MTEAPFEEAPLYPVEGVEKAVRDLHPVARETMIEFGKVCERGAEGEGEGFPW